MASTEAHAVSIDEAVALAIGLHRQGESTDAETLYRRILAIAPAHPDATHFLGVLLHQRDRSDEGLALIERSVALDSNNADRHNNHGNAAAERGRLETAARSFEHAVALAPAHASAWGNLGSVLGALGRSSEAEAAFRRSIELDPQSVIACNNFANFLSRQRRAKEAVEYYCKAIAIAPDHAPSKRMLGIAYYMLGQNDAAAAVYRKWLEEEPQNPIAAHMLAACSGEAVPERASDEFVARTFDDFASSFDRKLESLGYQAPRLVVDRVQAMLGAPARGLAVLDAGCGTGLCGPLVRGYADRLVGVDLSAGMIAIARSRGYDELVEAELTDYLAQHPEAFDLIVSADTLVYFGDLAPVLLAAAQALRARGAIVFTVERHEGDADYRINPHGRYSHARAYVERALVAARFAECSIEPVDLRMEAGTAVAGFVVSARRT